MTAADLPRILPSSLCGCAPPCSECLDEITESAYDTFFSTVVDAELSVGQQAVHLTDSGSWHDPTSTFHHICSAEGAMTRTFDIERVRRVPWIGPMIRGYEATSSLKSWQKQVRTKRGRAQHFILSLTDFSYIIVFRKEIDRFHLVTAYPVERLHRRKDLKKDHETWRKLRGFY